MKILEIYNNINPEDDVIFQSREIVKDLLGIWKGYLYDWKSNLVD